MRESFNKRTSIAELKHRSFLKINITEGGMRYSANRMTSIAELRNICKRRMSIAELRDICKKRMSIAEEGMRDIVKRRVSMNRSFFGKKYLMTIDQ